MACVRNFVVSMLCLSVFGRPISGLTVSSQNLELDIGRGSLYNASSSSASIGAPAYTLDIPPNPFIYEYAGYRAVYKLEGEGYIQVLSVMRMIVAAALALELERRSAGKHFTDPIPGGSVLRTALDLGRNVTWEIHQSKPIVEALSYQHAQIALQGTEDVARAYLGLCRQYTFSLIKLSSMQLVARGSLSRPQDAVTD